MKPRLLTTCPVVITGVSKGLGRAFLEILQPTGRRLVCVGRSMPEGAERDDARFVQVDLSKWRGEPLLADALPAEAAGVVFISNAGTVDPTGRSGTLDGARVEAALGVNLTAPMLLCNELVARTEPRGTPLHVINISTGAALHALAGLSVYCASKAAARMHFECVAAEDERLTVSHVDPGALDTDMQTRLRSQATEAVPAAAVFEAYQARGQLVKPEDAAREILTREGLL